MKELGSASVSVRRTVFSFPAMLIVALAMVTLLTCRSRFNDPDTWWHLKLGEIIWNSHSVPQKDLFSYTANSHPWIPHEWLSQITIYSAYRMGGYRGLWLWLFGLASLVFALLYALCSLYSGNAKVSLLGGLIGWFFGTISLAVRPLILGHLFLVAELLILHLARTRNRRWLWALPPLFAVWVNCHGSYLAGLLVLGISVFCSFIELRAGRLVSARRVPRERSQLCAVCLLSAAALLVNPVGPKLLTYPLDTFTRQSEGLANVTEWRSLDVSDERGVGLCAVAAVIGLALLLRPNVLHLEELLLLLLGFAAGLKHTRLVFVFGILAAPILCRLLSDAWDRYQPDRDNRVANAILMSAAIILMLAAFPTREHLERQVKASSPVGAVEFIRRTGLPGPMLNQYDWGGYLIWALPEQKVFIDGRGDIFDWTGVLGEYGRWATLKEDPRLLLQKYRIRYCLLPKSAPMARVLAHMSGWERIYADELSVIFARRATA